DDRAARLQQHAQPTAREARGERAAVRLGVHRPPALVADAEAAAEVGVLEADALASQRLDELEHPVERLVERRGLEDLRADVAADSRDAQVPQPRRVAVRLDRADV